MPYINLSTGDIAQGVGGGWASLNNIAFAVGGVGGWQDAFHIAFANGDDGWVCSTFNKDTREIARLSFGGAIIAPNTTYAGGGHTAAWVGSAGPDKGVYATTGLRLPNAGLLGMSPDGAIGYKPDYQSGGPSVVRELDGSEWTLTGGHAASLQLLGARRAVWMEGMAIGVANLPPVHYYSQGGIWKASAAYANGQWWISYYSEQKGIVLHPFASASSAYPILPKGDGWHMVGAIGPESIRIAISKTEGEAPGDVWGYDVNVRTGAATPIPCWAGGTPTTFPFLPMDQINPVPIPPEPPDPPIPPEPPEPPDPPDPPVPPKPPLPPKPFPDALPMGVPMDSQRVALRLGQMFASVDPNAVLKPDGYRYDTYGRGPFPGWYPVRFLKDSSQADAWCAFVMSQPHDKSDPRLLLRPETLPAAAMSADATEFSGDIASEFGVKPDVPVEEWGGYEAWNGWTLQGQGINIVLVQYDRDNEKYTSACLTVVPL